MKVNCWRKTSRCLFAYGVRKCKTPEYSTLMCQLHFSPGLWIRGRQYKLLDLRYCPTLRNPAYKVKVWDVELRAAKWLQLVALEVVECKR
jgi:hypothetical protein